MLPLGVNLELYNLIKEWATKCNAHVAIINTEKEIKIYTNKPGQMIGPHGTLVDEYQRRLNSISRYKKHKFIINPIDMVITPESPEITQEEYEKSLDEYFEARFSMWEM